MIEWWAEYYRTHDHAQVLAAAGHLLAIAYAATFALRGDRAALRLTRTRTVLDERRRSLDLQAIRRAHPHVIAGLALALITGVAQLLAQLPWLLPSPIFWIKMSMLVLLLANGRMLQRAEAQPDLRGLRAAATRSLVLWITLIILGLLLTTILPVPPSS